MKLFRYLFFLVLISFLSNEVNAQVYYWVGGSGNWTDTLHWSNESGGAPNAQIPPVANSIVIFDANSFNANGQSVTVDTSYINVKAMFWNLDSTGVIGASATTFYNPNFVGISATDSMRINGSLVLHPTMNFTFNSPIRFTGGSNDSIVPAGKTFGGNITIETFGNNLKVNGNLVTNGNFIYKRGGLYINNISINCRRFDANYSGTKNLYANNTIFNINGADTVVTLRPMSTLNGTNRVFNITNSSASNYLLIGTGGITQNWGKLHLSNKNVRFISDTYFDTISHSNSIENIEIIGGRKLKSNIFSIDGNCGKYITFKGISTQATIDNLSNWNIDFFKLQNLKCNVGIPITATNTIDLGNNTNWTITADNTAPIAMFWIGGQGDFYDGSHWSLSSGGAASGCIPTPNDTVYFNAPSFNNATDTLFISQDVRVATANFSGVDVTVMMKGNTEKMFLSKNLYGSSNLMFDWNGRIEMTGTTACTLQTGTDGIWGVDIYKTGTGALTLSDDFSSNKNFYHTNGAFNTNGQGVELFSFSSSHPTQSRSLNFLNSEFTVKGNEFKVDTINLNLSNYHTSGTTFNFVADSLLTLFSPGTDSLHIVNLLKGTSVQIERSIVRYHSMLDISPGSTLILRNASVHEFHELNAVGTCDSLITIKSDNTTFGPANLGHKATWSNNMTVDYALIDNVTAGLGSPYIIDNSIVSASSTNWFSGTGTTSVSVGFLIAAPNDTISQNETSPSIASATNLVIPSNVTVVSSVLTINGIQTTGGTTMDECNVAISGASTLATTSLTPPTVSSVQLNTTTLPGANGVVNLVLSQDPGPAGNFIIDTVYLTVTYISPYIPTKDTLYWYGGTGDWSDINHWSYNSGNIPANPATCIPTFGDNVIFDELSFSANDQYVTVDNNSYFASMTWQSIDDSVFLHMNEDLTAFESVTLSPLLTVDKGIGNGKLKFQPNDTTAYFDQDSAVLDINLEYISFDLNDTLQFASNIDNGNFNSFIVYGGVMNTNDFNLHSNSFLITSTFTPSEVNLGNSTFELIAGYADYAGISSTVNSGTSVISVNHSNIVSSNYFRGNSQAFNKVELYFNPNNYSIVKGNNTFDTLIVGAGSKLTIDSLSNNTINNQFIMRGTCVDSIFLRSSGINNNFTFTSSAVLDAMCLNVRRSTATAIGAGSFITYFSSNIFGNSGAWNFNTTPATTAIIDTTYNFCLGDTMTLVNASTVFLNDFAGLTYNWNFGDGESFVGDTSYHYYQYPGTYYLTLTATYSNLCSSVDRDTIIIFSPSVSLTSSINGTTMCAEEMVSFYANSSNGTASSLYQYFINGAPVFGSPLDSTQIDTLNLPNPSTISALLYENGCVVSSDTITMYVTPLDTVTLSVPSTTICAGQSVTFTPSGTSVYRYYKNGVAITPFTTLPYTASNIANGDVFYVIGRNNTTLCSDTSNILTFVVNALPTITSFVSSDANNIICANDTVDFTVTSATGVSYNYYINSTLYANSTLATYGITNIPNGGVVTAVAINAAGCSSAPSNTITHLVNPIPNVTLSSTDTAICEGVNVQLTASNATLYEYFVNGVSIGAPSTNQYYYTETLNNNDLVSVTGSLFGCFGYSDTIEFIVTPSPVTTLTSDIGNVICQGDTVNLTATSAIATNFTFVRGIDTLYNGPLNTLQLSGINNNNIISVTGSAAGCEFTDNIIFTVNVNPVASIFTSDANNTICQGESITFTGTGGNSYEYFVNGVNTFTGIGPYSTTTLPPGQDTIYIIATNTVTGCSTQTNSVIVNNIELPVTTLATPNNPICAGQPVVFLATSTVADNYQFFVNSISQGLPSASNTFTSSTLTNGSIVFVRGYNDGCSNPGEDTITMVVNANPVATITGSTVFCQNTPQVFTGSSSILGSSFEFFLNSVLQSTTNTYDASSLANGSYSLNLVTTSPGGCTDNETINISVLQNPNVTLSGLSSICSGESVTFTAGGALSYQYFVNGSPATSGSTFTTSSLSNGDVVTVSGSTSAGCTTTSPTQITMTVSPTPNVSLVSDDADNILCSGTSVTFTASGGTNYQFFVNGNSQGAASSNNTFVTSALTNGQTVTVQGESYGCIDYSTPGITFLVSNSPVVSLSNLGDTVLCSDTPTQLVANGANDYLFYVNGIPQGTFGPTNTFNQLLNNGDIVSVDGMTNTCVSTANSTYEFSVFNYPTTSLTSSDPDNTICYGDPVTFTGTGATDYEYFIDGISLGISGPVYFTEQLLNGQSISLIGYNAECATSAPQVLNFTVNTLELNTSANPSNFMVCEGSSFELQASGADEYEIFVNNTSQGPQSTNSTFVLNNLNDGDVITLNGYSALTGCTQSDDQTIFIQVYQQPLITNNGSTIICEGDSVVLYSNSPTGNQWFLNGTAIANETDSLLIVYSSGDYSLETTHGGFGELYSVGYNSNGEFGDGTNLNNMYPSLAETITDVNVVSSGLNHTMVVDGSGQLFVFGDNSSGQLGNGTYTASNTPLTITTVPSIADAAAAENSSIVVTATGELFTWGDNNDGQLGVGNTTVFNTPQWVVGMTGFTKVAAGKTHFLALKNDGTVWSVGNNNFGQLGNGTTVSSNVFVQISGLNNITKISAGDYHSMAIDNTGSLYVWGNNGSGQLGLNDLNSRTTPTLSGLGNVISVAGGNAHTLIVTENNRVYSTGANNFGQLGTGNVVGQDSPIHLTSIDAVVEVAAGRHHSLFLKNDGTVWGAGRNDNKQLGNLPFTSTPTITRIPNVEGVTIIDGGNQSSHFIYGNDATCVSATSTITVNTAPLPIITYSGGVLNTSAVGVSYQWFINDIEIINSNSQSVVPTANGNYTVAVTYSNGCVRLSNVFAYPVLGMDEAEIATVVLAPNPTNGKFCVVWSEGLSIEAISIFDVTGKLLQDVSLTSNDNEYKFDLSNYADGVYTIRAKGNNGWSKSMRVIKN